MRIARWQKDLWFEFLVEDLCGLCGNYGFMPKVERSSPAGHHLVMEAGRYCICPNGRAIKKQMDKLKAKKVNPK